MGTLHGNDQTPKGAVVNGVTLGEPAWSAYDEDGKPAAAIPLWDDHRIPDGDVEVTAVVEGEPLPPPESESTVGGGAAYDEVVWADGPVPVRVRSPRLVEVDMIAEEA